MYLIFLNKNDVIFHSINFQKLLNYLSLSIFNNYFYKKLIINIINEKVSNLDLFRLTFYPF